MRILVCPLYDNTFSSRFRIYRYLPYWEQAGIECDVVPAVRPTLQKACEQFPRIYHRWRVHLSEISIRKKSIRQSSSYDLVLIQKGFTTIDWRWWPILQQKQKVPFLFDVDDAVHLEPGLVPPKVLRFLWDAKQIEKIAGAAGAVVVGNPYLAEDYQEIFPPGGRDPHFPRPSLLYLYAGRSTAAEGAYSGRRISYRLVGKFFFPSASEFSTSHRSADSRKISSSQNADH